jgi:Fe-S cluster assembly protein SufD
MQDKNKKFDFLGAFEAVLKHKNIVNDPERLRIRDEAFSYFKMNGFPNKKVESWRFTDISELENKAFTVAPNHQNQPFAKETLPIYFLGADKAMKLIFIDGWFHPQHSAMPTQLKDQINIHPFAAANGAVYNDISETLRNSLAIRDNSISALNTAFCTDGVYLDIAENTQVEFPIHIINIALASTPCQLISPRHIVKVGKNSSAVIIESWVTDGNECYFSNAVADIKMSENSSLKHYRYQNESLLAYHMNHTYVEQMTDSRYKHIAFEKGGKITRGSINTVLNGKGASATLNGLYLGSGAQHIDNHTQIAHAEAHCASKELYRGILNDKSTAVFDGKILVHPDAQKTESEQSNSCLLLTDKVKIDAKPQLEIYADDVKCSHGSTVGQLDKEQLFYLQSRGIGIEEAKAILVYAFAEAVLNSIDDKPLHAFMRAELQEYLDFAAEPSAPQNLKQP